MRKKLFFKFPNYLTFFLKFLKFDYQMEAYFITNSTCIIKLRFENPFLRINYKCLRVCVRAYKVEHFNQSIRISQPLRLRQKVPDKSEDLHSLEANK